MALLVLAKACDVTVGTTLTFRPYRVDRTGRSDAGDMPVAIEWMLESDDVFHRRRFAPRAWQHHGSRDTTYVPALAEIPDDLLRVTRAAVALRACLQEVDHADS